MSLQHVLLQRLIPLLFLVGLFCGAVLADGSDLNPGFQFGEISDGVGGANNPEKPLEYESADCGYPEDVEKCTPWVPEGGPLCRCHYVDNLDTLVIVPSGKKCSINFCEEDNVKNSPDHVEPTKAVQAVPETLSGENPIVICEETMPTIHHPTDETDLCGLGCMVERTGEICKITGASNPPLRFQYCRYYNCTNETPKIIVY